MGKNKILYGGNLFLVLLFIAVFQQLQTGHLDADFVQKYMKLLDLKYFNGKESIVKGRFI